MYVCTVCTVDPLYIILVRMYAVINKLSVPLYVCMYVRM